MTSAPRTVPVASPEPSRSAVVTDGVRLTLISGYAMIVLLVGGVGVWASVTPLAGAIVAGATVVVDSNIKKVQHPTGGVVGEIHARDGDRVKAGDMLIRLDETVTRANLQVVSKQMTELAVRIARLTAERDETPKITFPASIVTRLGELEVAAIVAGETKLFDNRRSGRDGQKSVLGQRIAQLRQEVTGVEATLSSRDRELTLVKTELASYHELWTKNLISIAKYTSSMREETRLLGERNQLTAQHAQVRGKISEVELQILQIDAELRTEVSRDIREAQAKEAELSERRIAAEDMLKRIDIRAPVSGFVHQSNAHTIGGVVTPSEPVMMIVPEHEMLVLEARIAPQDIDSVRAGTEAIIRLTAFNQQSTPELEGKVFRVAADLTREQQTGLAYYIARISISAAEMNKVPNITLIPGMPAEVHIRTSERTAMSYMLKPLQDQFARAFKER